jgi:hypothetical protein
MKDRGCNQAADGKVVADDQKTIDVLKKEAF